MDMSLDPDLDSPQDKTAEIPISGTMADIVGKHQELSKKSDAEILNLRGSDHADQQANGSKSTGNTESSTDKALVTTFMIMASKLEISLTRILAVCFLVLITLVSLFIVCASAEEEKQMSGPAKSREELDAMESCDGTWAQTYMNVDDQSKQGLELLFRCKIIPTDEFAHSKVNQEHIGECVWIATHMLRQRPLDDWLAVWPEAQRTFEESVTACFAARTDVRSTFYDYMDDGTQDAQHSPRTLQYLSKTDDASTQPFVIVGPGEPLPGSGHSTHSAEQSSRAPVKSRSPDPKRELPPILKTPADRKSLMERCRQIMAASDAQRKPWDSKSSKSSASASK